MAAKGPNRTRKGGVRTVGALVERQIRRSGETRGFSESRLLTHWAEVAGADVARICRPVKVSWSRREQGSVLTLLTTGAQAPMLQMRLPQLRDRVNACYGYRAIAGINITQTAPTGFAEGQASFDAGPPRRKPAPSPETREKARAQVGGIADPALKDALERLGANIISKAGREDGPDRSRR
ncbi:DUF721 domain-containing protein [Jannaschia aquimarina]|uniref:DUF721 domain-containing protein n=1 Tax=Jannaschia aquimarina TaxID=935700 RepID=A0A0D1CPK1_9RHOB|nr:DciA family protein [Jannaschia aquimarina]KIT16687.1 hypothetical protein jaqu_14750 [Jannaschia aquimarina]SNS55081.1 hypothetical protein SAMN05421775_101403 [Jannaschia aquimarina]